MKDQGVREWVGRQSPSSLLVFESYLRAIFTRALLIVAGVRA